MNPIRNKLLALGLSFLIFITLLRVGTWLGELKPLWNDEIYSQVFGIEKLSYGQILSGQIPEGNNFPLFYVLQKAVCDVTGHKYPHVWKGEWNVDEPSGQVILRIVPNVCMSLAIAALFYFFCVEYSLLAAVYSFFTALSAFVVWAYWAEARPYALWFCLTVLQGLFYLRLTRHKEWRESHWFWFCIVNILLSLTVVVGIVPVVIVSFMLYALRVRSLTGAIGATILPIGITAFYYSHGPTYNFLLPQDWSNLIFDNLSAEWLLLLLGFSIIVAFRKISHREKIPALSFAVFTAMMLIIALALLWYLNFKYNPSHESFQISSRYFVFLAGTGMVAVTLFGVEAIQFYYRDRWLKINLIMILVGVLILRLIRTYAQVTGSGIY